MTYAIKEIFSTIQGEGHHTGTAAVFVRFAGCNFWSGLERDRLTSSLCPFCDTDFVGTNGENGGKYREAGALAALVRSVAPRAGSVVCTGGEPLLQLDRELVEAFQAQGFAVHVETNGSVDLPDDNLGIDWVCCSPKSPDLLKLKRCDELKVIIPAQAHNLKHYDEWFGYNNAQHRFVQPEDGPDGQQERSFKACAILVMANPEWRVSVQTHKLLGVP